jgi:hypothetical protein
MPLAKKSGQPISRSRAVTNNSCLHLTPAAPGARYFALQSE